MKEFILFIASFTRHNLFYFDGDMTAFRPVVHWAFVAVLVLFQLWLIRRTIISYRQQFVLRRMKRQLAGG